jgi:uncharacterized delta-60 repeat protein
MSLRILNRWLSSAWTSGARPSRPARTATPRVEALESRNLMAAGALDTTFATLGKMTRPFDLGGARNDLLADVAIQADGKIVAVGTADRSSTAHAFAVMRFNANGTLDTSFGNLGRQFISFGSGDARASAVAIDRFGRIVVAGTADPFGDDDFAVARLTPNGQLDKSFDGDGRRTVGVDIHGDPGEDQATDVAIDAQGRIVLGGFAEFETNFFSGTDYDFAVVRLNANGSLDTSFDGDGKRTFGFDIGDGGGSADTDIARSLAIDNVGRIVIAGSAAIGSEFNTVMAVARLTPSGKLDTTFSGDGKQTVAFVFGHASHEEANGVVIDPLGRIVLAGDANGDMGVARLLANGSLDTSFDGDGKQTVAFDRGGGFHDVAYALAIDPLGRIVLVGSAERNNNHDYDMAVARLTANGTIDSTFGVSGKTTISFAGGLRGNSSLATAVAIDAQGRIVVGGSTRFFSPDYDFALARLLSTASLSAHPFGGGQALNA